MGIMHMGIFLGEGRFIHAASRDGPESRVVEISESDRGYFAHRLVAARRFLAGTLSKTNADGWDGRVWGGIASSGVDSD